MSRYAVWKDPDLGIYDVVRWDSHHTVVVVQTNIRTYEKARVACAIWQQRENEKIPD